MAPFMRVHGAAKVLIGPYWYTFLPPLGDS